MSERFTKLMSKKISTGKRVKFYSQKKVASFYWSSSKIVLIRQWALNLGQFQNWKNIFLKNS